MLGGPVSREHGGPVRLYVAPMYGYKSLKWMSRIEVVDRVEPGYWETVGNYDVEGWVGHSNGRNDPADLTAPAAPASLLLRFDRVERAVHWVNAALFLVLVATGAILYLEPLRPLVGRRALVEDIHVYAGLALPSRSCSPCPDRGAGPSGTTCAGSTDGQRTTARWLRALFRPGPERRIGAARRCGSGSSTPARSSTPPSSPGPAW